jgi:endonuclease G, mitochondrial
MENEKLYNGFNEDFLIDDQVKEKVPFPILGNKYKSDIAPVVGNELSIVNYLNYSVQLSASRKFPFFTASNIDGELFKKANRAPSWKKDERLKEYQWGKELYSAEKSDFDKGHMTKREDVQWGETPGLAQKAADSTFFYTNAVPQHKDLNRQIWKSLENYVLHTETRKKSLKICVFTGPVLTKKDPPFVTIVNNETVLIPIVFWKVVVFPKDDGKLYRVGFMMSQKKLLTENSIVGDLELESATAEDEIFMQFNNAATYQVNVSLIEQLTNIKMPSAIDSYNDERSRMIILKEIEIDPDLERDSVSQFLGYTIENIIL